MKFMMKNKYQELFKQLQQERNSSPLDVNDHLMVFDGLNTFIRSFGATPAYTKYIGEQLLKYESNLRIQSA